MTSRWLKAFYNSAEWKAFRLQILRRDGRLCCACREPANTVHHKLDIETHPHLALDPGNCETLCHVCHGAADGVRGDQYKQQGKTPNRFLHTVANAQVRAPYGKGG